MTPPYPQCQSYQTADLPTMFQLLDLPAELVHTIAAQLTYPDSLALKLSCRYLHHTVHPSVQHRVDWMISRINVGLPVPMAQKCNMKTDAGFCSSPEVRQILWNRRTHQECHQYGQGRCLVSSTLFCGQIRSTRGLSTAPSAKLSKLPMRGIPSILLFLQSSVYIALVTLLMAILYKQ